MFTTENIISVKDLNVVLNGHRVLDDVSFDIPAGSIAAIVGPNGSGKTTLMKAMLGLIPYQGESMVLGVPSSGVSRRVADRIGYVPQHLDFDRTMPVTVAELLDVHLRDRTRKNRIAESLASVDAADLLPKMIGVLSGGEFQRVLLALALLNNPDILFLDEPSAGVDIEGAGEFYARLQDLRTQRSITIVMVSHDMDVVFRHATQVLCINHALICQGSPHSALTPDTMKHLYGPEHALYPHKEKR
ncbi:MAG: metal ABC transporter ATP-binding protein [Patescibacteria group bacterium]